MHSEEIRINDVALRVATGGEGEPVVLLHGWGASHKIWRRVWDEFTKRFRVIAPDWPGFGASSKPDGPYTMEWYAGLIGPLMDAYRIESASVVGHSMGGCISAMFALRHPGRVRKLVLVNAVVQGATAFPIRTKLLTLPGLRRIAWWLCSVRAFRKYVAKDFTFACPLPDEIVDDIACGTFSSLLGTISSMRQADLAARLAELNVPTHVVYTNRDATLLPTQLELQRVIPNARIDVIPETGHCPMIERPDDFTRVVFSFLSAPTPV